MATVELCQVKNWVQAIEKSRGETPCEVCRLNRVKAGVEVRIKRICGTPEMQKRLRELGFCEDSIIKLLTSQTNLICQVCEARMAISEQIAKTILVEPLQLIPTRA